MIFLLNENIPPSLASFLIGEGYQAFHVREVNLLGRPDKEIFDFAFKQGHIIITHDLDYSRIHAYSGKSKPSIILFRIDPLTLKKMQDILTSNLKKLELDLEKGSFVVIEEGQIRIRSLPI